MHDLNKLFSKPISSEIVNFINELAFALESMYFAQAQCCFDKLKSDMSRCRDELEESL
jgi:hypothetical protein